MKHLHIYVVVLFSFHTFFTLSAQNNSIFGGGKDDGFASATGRMNNSIFGGGNDDGFASATSRTNNSIFGGGNDDGFATARTELWQFSPINIRVYLQGPFNGVDMNDQLRHLPSFPMQEPYSAMGYTLQNKACGISTDVLTNNRIVDWVLIQLRTSETEVAATRAALLQYDGDVVDIDGQSYVRFLNLPQREYYIVIMHRNSLGVMSERAMFVVAE